jgi:hypothetical protein
MTRDIDQIVALVKQRMPEIEIHQLQVKHPETDDDGLWYFSLRGFERGIQIESSEGCCPFLIEHSEMKSTAEAEIATTIEEACEKIVSYMAGVRNC